MQDQPLQLQHVVISLFLPCRMNENRKSIAHLDNLLNAIVFAMQWQRLLTTMPLKASNTCERHYANGMLRLGGSHYAMCSLAKSVTHVPTLENTMQNSTQRRTRSQGHGNMLPKRRSWVPPIQQCACVCGKYHSVILIARSRVQVVHEASRSNYHGEFFWK